MAASFKTAKLFALAAIRKIASSTTTREVGTFVGPAKIGCKQLVDGLGVPRPLDAVFGVGFYGALSAGVTVFQEHHAIFGNGRQHDPSHPDNDFAWHMIIVTHARMGRMSR
jgi:hypothetical protein